MPFIPSPDSDAVAKLREKLGTLSMALKIRVSTAAQDRVKNCYANVEQRIAQTGSGRMQLGWAVWQHSDLFIEGEHHAVLDPGDGKPLVDCTPHKMPDGRFCQDILFIPDENAAYDPNSTDLVNNFRVPLVTDPRVAEAIKLMADKTALYNSVPGVDISLPPEVAAQVLELDYRISNLLSSAMQAVPIQRGSNKLGRNDPCPCNSGKKYKKCHGAVA
jgi:hypothetical protein